jgi:hypothetical protein
MLIKTASAFNPKIGLNPVAKKFNQNIKLNDKCLK